MSARKSKQPIAPKKPIQRPVRPKTTFQHFFKPTIFSIVLLIASGLLWWTCNSIGHSMTEDNIRGVAQTVKIESCLSYDTWKDEQCPNKQPGNYVPFWNGLGLLLFLAVAGFALFNFLRAAWRWIMDA